MAFATRCRRRAFDFVSQLPQHGFRHEAAYILYIISYMFLELEKELDNLWPEA